MKPFPCRIQSLRSASLVALIVFVLSFPIIGFMEFFRAQASSAPLPLIVPIVVPPLMSGMSFVIVLLACFLYNKLRKSVEDPPLFGTQPQASISSPRNRSTLRGLLAGLAAKFLVTMFLTPSIFLVASIWVAYSNHAHLFVRLPVSPDSNEWLILRVVDFVGAAVAGVAVIHWSKEGSNAAVAIFVAFGLLAAIAQPQETASWIRMEFWILAAPIGVICGAIISLRWTGQNLTIRSSGTALIKPSAAP